MHLPFIIPVILALCGDALSLVHSAETVDFTGVNLAGGEFCGPKPGEPMRVNGKGYFLPNEKEIAYYAGKGMNIIRLPFKWEVLQPAACTPLVPYQIETLKQSVSMATRRGMVVLLDPHNTARYYDKIVGESDVTIAMFADFWGRLAAAFADDHRVWFGLVNEPNRQSTPIWLNAANGAIAAIRAAKANNLILVPGNHWSGAHSWVGSGKPNDNGTAMLGVKDPIDHWVYEAHQYVDSDSSGTKKPTVSATIGVERLKTFTAWCRTHHVRAFLGEFAAALPGTSTEEAVSRAAIDNMLTDMEKNRDVWLGWTWWAGGPAWGDYMYALDPRKDGSERPQMAWLMPHLNRVPPTVAIRVQGGTGGGRLVSGTTCTITATPPAGKRFDHWEGDTAWLDVPASPTAVLTVAYRDLTVTAICAAMP